jgi:transcriptional regulator with XRE-family HTH domain
MSQLDLALTCGASPRHVSFLETNRSRPSRDMVETLADAMVLPRAARNALLLAAGFAPLYPATPLAAEALAPFRSVLAEMMARHAPYPALVVDRWWTVLDANQSARMLLGALHDGEGSGITNAEALAGAASGEQAPRCSPVKHCIADQRIVC